MNNIVSLSILEDNTPYKYVWKFWNAVYFANLGKLLCILINFGQQIMRNNDMKYIMIATAMW